MASVKEEAIQIIRRLPDDATMDDVMAELYFKTQVDAGLKELDEGKGIPHEEVKRRMAKWLER
jgi:predicted transcriptional regulator